MAENVIILGAGASVHCGAPVMSNFLDKAEELARSNLVDKKSKEAINLILDFIAKLQGVHSKSYLDLDNVETVFNAIEMATILGEFKEYSASKINNLKRAMVKLIVTTLEETINLTDGESIYAGYFLLADYIKRGFVGGVNNVSIITFNYDVALDWALVQKGNYVNYCLNKDERIAGTKLLKLHGSTNWKKENGKIIPMEISTVLNEAQKRVFKRSFDDKDIFIIPPSWNKTQYHETISKVWKQAVQELSEARNIYIVGYSLPETDVFFKYLFALGTFSKERIQNIWVVNKDVSVHDKYRSIIGAGIKGRYSFVETDFNGNIIHDIYSGFIRKDLYKKVLEY